MLLVAMSQPLIGHVTFLLGAQNASPLVRQLKNIISMIISMYSDSFSEDINEYSHLRDFSNKRKNNNNLIIIQEHRSLPFGNMLNLLSTDNINVLIISESL